MDIPSFVLPDLNVGSGDSQFAEFEIESVDGASSVGGSFLDEKELGNVVDRAVLVGGNKDISLEMNDRVHLEMVLYSPWHSEHAGGGGGDSDLGGRRQDSVK